MLRKQRLKRSKPMSAVSRDPDDWSGHHLCNNSHSVNIHQISSGCLKEAFFNALTHQTKIFGFLYSNDDIFNCNKRLLFEFIWTFRRAILFQTNSYQALLNHFAKKRNEKEKWKLQRTATTKSDQTEHNNLDILVRFPNPLASQSQVGSLSRWWRKW